IEEAMDEGMILGITSTGRDGESTDVVTGTDKPKVFLDVGTIVSVPRQLYDLADAGLELLQMSKYRTSLGEILLCRVVESGYVQIAGPVVTAETKKMCVEMEQLGAEMIIIDGAIDRKSIAAPDTSDGIILSTGAVLSRKMNKVVEQTAHVVHIYGLPELKDANALSRIEEFREQEKILLIKEGETIMPDLKTGLGGGRFLDEAIDEEVKYIYLPGAFTKSVIADISMKKIKGVTFVVKDPTKIFMDAVSWQQWAKKGLKLTVLKNINVAAITVNPFAPGGYSFDHEELRDAMQAAMPEIPVIDVRL
ncbi:MAG: hypothetical protein RR661_02225, partial [Anaerovoracaceae bacterium]